MEAHVFEGAVVKAHDFFEGAVVKAHDFLKVL